MINKFEDQFQYVFQSYGLNDKILKIESLTSGLINQTWKITTGENEFVLQCINQSVFKQPQKIAKNIRLIADYLKQNHPNYFFAAPLKTKSEDEMVFSENGFFFRLFPFIGGSHSKDILKTYNEAFEAARQFGRFTKLLSEIDTSKLEITIPQFHDLELLIPQFKIMKLWNCYF